MPDDLSVWPGLDDALGRLHADKPIDERVLAAAREKLIDAAAAEVRAIPRRSRRWRWIAAAAAVVVVITGLLLAQTVSFTGDKAPASAAAEELNTVAAKIVTDDVPLQPGQFRYTARQGAQVTGATGTSGRHYVWKVATLLELWMPADFTAEWLTRSTANGTREWLDGTEAEARADGVNLDRPAGPGGEMRARCGDFTAAMERPPREPCVGFNPWQGGLTPEFLAGLPRDPQALYDLIRRDIPTRGSDPDTAILIWTTQVIGSPLMTADLRAALYRALGHIEGLEITERTTTLDGQAGEAFGLTRGSTRMEIVIDPATGRFIGQREWSDGVLRATTSALADAVVGALGQKP